MSPSHSSGPTQILACWTGVTLTETRTAPLHTSFNLCSSSATSCWASFLCSSCSSFSYTLTKVSKDNKCIFFRYPTKKSNLAIILAGPSSNRFDKPPLVQSFPYNALASIIYSSLPAEHVWALNHLFKASL